MKRLWMSGAAAVMAMSISGVSAQQPSTTQTPTTPPQTPAKTHPAGAQHAMTTTLQGCVYREKAVQGRTPNVAEKAGVLEDYILVASTDTPAAKTGTTGTTAPTTTTGATGTTGATMTASKAYKLEKIDDERLRAVVGKRVEVTGKMDMERGDTAGAATTGAPARDKSMGPDEIELPEFEVQTIREVAGTCPATPNIRK